MRIVYMGTPEIAVPSLRFLAESKHQVVGVFTQPDRPKGRGHHTVPTAVKAAAAEYGILVYQPLSLRKGEDAAAAMETLRDLAPDLIVVMAYGQILPKQVLDLPRYGCINLHASLLPAYRGAAPIQWALLNGETRTGITAMQMAEGLDTGDMLLKKEIRSGRKKPRLSCMIVWRCLRQRHWRKLLNCWNREKYSQSRRMTRNQAMHPGLPRICHSWTSQDLRQSCII